MRRIFALFLMLAAMAPRLAAAQGSGAPADLSDARRDLARVEASARSASTDDQLADLRARALKVQDTADADVQAETADLDAVNARLTQLGPVPAAPGTESPELARQRQALQASHAALDGQLKEARLLSVAAGQAADDLAERRRELFNHRLFQRGDSPLTPAFWTRLAGALPPDLARIASAVREEVAVARRAPEPGALLLVIAGLVAAGLLAGPARLWLRAQGKRRLRDHETPTELRSSGFALWRLAVDAVLPWLAALALELCARWSGVLSTRGGELAQSAVAAVAWAALVRALGRALLSPRLPAWRLLPVSDRSAARMQPLVSVTALVTAAGLLVTDLNRVVGASLAATVAAHCAIAVVYAALAAAALVVLGLGRTAAEAAADADAQSSPDAQRASGSWSLVAVAVAAAAAVALAATLLGYTVFGALVAGQIYWLAVLAGAAFLLLTFVDDLVETLFAAEGVAARWLLVVFDLHRSTVDQIGVLLSAALRVLILLVALSLATSPFGRGARSALAQFSLAGGHGVRIGALDVSPGALLGGVASLLVGVALVRGVQRWLDKRYLPATDWDAGVRNSVSTAVGYLGIGLAILWALAASGLGLQRVALIASALSVGIGFGLNQIVQNFVSGLILLAERPVKVGDWVSVGGQEGDVANIRVRATEIRMFDRSTLIVPNSELVTKTVQNKTLHGTLGRVALELAVSDTARAGEVRDMILDACRQHSAVLADPEPKVFIDSVTGGAAAFKSFCYVESPRAAYSTRSDLLFSVLAAFAVRGISLAGSSTSVELAASSGLEDLVKSARAAPHLDAHDDGSAPAKPGVGSAPPLPEATP